MKTTFLFCLRLFVYDQVKTRLSELQAEVEELNQPQKHGNVLCDCRFILPLLLSTPTFWFSLDRKQQSHKLAESVENGNTLILPTLLPACRRLLFPLLYVEIVPFPRATKEIGEVCMQATDSDFVMLMTLLATLIFIFHLTSPTLTSSLVKNQP